MPNPDWFGEQSDHALACAKYGDCIFDEVQNGASELEAAWVKASSDWYRLLLSSTRGFLGLREISDPRWLYFVLFRPEKFWPRDLTQEERALLRLAASLSDFHPSGQKVDRGMGITNDPDRAASYDETLEAMKRYASLFKTKIALPMYKEYQRIAEEYAPKIQTLCDSVYGEPCSKEEAKNMFKGDLQRGWKMNSLDVTPPMSRVFPLFMDWISA